MGFFSERVLEWIRKEAKVKEPLDSILFCILFVFVAYLPSLALSILVSIFFSKDEKMTYPPSLFVYNNPDAVEI